MLYKTIIKTLFFKTYKCKILSVRHSALFINGAKATDTFVYITPHVDYSNYLKHKDIIQKQLQHRKVNINLEKLENLWSVYEDLKQQKIDYDKKKDKISEELEKVLKNDSEEEAVKKCKLKIALIKDNIKKLKVPLWSAEEAAIVEFLKLPNILHPKTPETANEVIYTYESAPSNQRNHLKIATESNLLHLKKNENYYLKGDAALFELGAKFFFSNILKKNGFIQLSNPDFVKSLIVEGCGGNPTDPNSTFILHHNEATKANINNSMHLTGGGSLCSFLAYHAKNVLYAKVLPLKYFCMGRQYSPAASEEVSLFHVSQSSVIEFFGATKDAEQAENVLFELIEILKSAYSNLGTHFRLSFVPAEKLLMSESLRLAIEMYSTSLKSYIEVGNVSLSGDFISKRLLFTYVDNKQSKFPHTISGTLLNVPKLLACILESGEFKIPDQFKVENWLN